MVLHMALLDPSMWLVNNQVRIGQGSCMVFGHDGYLLPYCGALMCVGHECGSVLEVWVCVSPSPIGGKMQVFCLCQRFWMGGWVGGMLSLVDRQHCPWAEAHCEA